MTSQQGAAVDRVERVIGWLRGVALTPDARRVSAVVRKKLTLPRSRRLTFAYDASGMRLVSHTDRIKPAPASDPVDRPRSPRHIVVELHDRRGGVLYRTPIPRPFPDDVEVPQPDGTMRRARVDPSGIVSVIVPIRRKATHVAIIAGAQAEAVPFPADRRFPVADGGALLGRFGLDFLPPAGGL